MFPSWLMKLGIVSGTEDGGTHADHGAALADGVGVVVAHTHRQAFHTDIIVFFSRYVNRKVVYFLKKFAIIPHILTHRGDCHESAYPNIGKIVKVIQQRKNFIRPEAGLALLLTDIDFQQNVLTDALPGGLSL